jgi:hypothetical protein
LAWYNLGLAGPLPPSGGLWQAVESSRVPVSASQGGVISNPIGVIVHDPTYTPICVGPPQSVFTYLYPDGTLSDIPFLWLSS